jgi:hypothetical protein
MNRLCSPITLSDQQKKRFDKLWHFIPTLSIIWILAFCLKTDSGAAEHFVSLAGVFGGGSELISKLSTKN